MTTATTMTPKRNAVRWAPATVRWGVYPAMTANPERHPRFRRRSEADLYEMDELDLVHYVRDAKSAHQDDQARLAVHMLLFKHERRMRHRVAIRMPEHLAHHADVAAEWVLERVSRSALKLGFEGRSVGEWVNWWGTAIDRQCISFWRTAQGQSLEREQSLPSEQAGEDDAAPDTLGEPLDVERLLAQACYSGVVQAVLAGIENPMHVEVLRLAFWDDLESSEVARRCETTAANVDQIKSRFKKVLKQECQRRGVTEP